MKISKNILLIKIKIKMGKSKEKSSKKD